MSAEGTSEISLDRVREMMLAHRVTKLFAKFLAANDNSKNQPYFGGDFGVLNILPASTPVADSIAGNRKSSIFKAALRFGWLDVDGNVYPAPNAKLILYPQYPEVRFSGYLDGVDREHRPSRHMGTTRVPNRILLLGVRDDGLIIGFAAGPESAVARQVGALANPEYIGVFVRVPLIGTQIRSDRESLLAELCRISRLGWINSKRLNREHEIMSCLAPNCGGYTLEAELGITPNGYSEPDFQGWEVKQHSVGRFERPSDSVITLMTPEPNDGFYVTAGVIPFVEKYGYADLRGRENRMNFGGIFRNGIRAARTGLRLELLGFQAETRKISDASGGIALLDDSGNEAAVWRYADLMGHWSRKHALAAYVPSITRSEPQRQYQYSSNVLMGIGTTFEKFLSAIAEGLVVYDPGIKVEGYPDAPHSKRRSQFRIKASNLPMLYYLTERVSACAD